MSRKLSQSTLIWLLDSLGLPVSILGTMTITLDFLKSSSRGGPRVPRPLLSSASRPKFFTRYSTVPSFATFKKSHAPPFFRPPPFCVHTHVILLCLSNHRRRATNGPEDHSSLVSHLLPGSPALLLVRCARPPPTSSTCSQLPHVSTCTHGTVLSGPALRVLKVRVLCCLFALSGPRAILFGTMQARGRGSAGKWLPICSCHSR